MTYLNEKPSVKLQYSQERILEVCRKHLGPIVIQGFCKDGRSATFGTHMVKAATIDALRNLGGMSYPEIGRAIGAKYHTGVYYAYTVYGQDVPIWIQQFIRQYIQAELEKSVQLEHKDQQKEAALWQLHLTVFG